MLFVFSNFVMAAETNDTFFDVTASEEQREYIMIDLMELQDSDLFVEYVSMFEGQYDAQFVYDIPNSVINYEIIDESDLLITVELLGIDAIMQDWQNIVDSMVIYGEVKGYVTSRPLKIVGHVTSRELTPDELEDLGTISRDKNGKIITSSDDDDDDFWHDPELPDYILVKIVNENDIYYVSLDFYLYVLESSINQNLSSEYESLVSANIVEVFVY